MLHPILRGALSVVNHTSGEGFDFGFSKSISATIPKTTAVTTYYVCLGTHMSFRFKHFYISTLGNNTNYSFKMLMSANCYMPAVADIITQQYNDPEIKNILAVYKDSYHDIYLEIDSSIEQEKITRILTDCSSILDTPTISTTAPTTDYELKVPIEYSTHYISTRKAIFKSGMFGNVTGDLYGNARTASTANHVANAMIVQFNGTTAVTYDGGNAKTVNITPSAIGAATSNHTHDTMTNTEIDALFT